MPSLIVDASVAVKWFFVEDRSDAAMVFRGREFNLIAPDLILAEVGNAAWKRRTKGEIEATDAVFVIEQVPKIFAQLVSISELATEAMRISASLPHPIYDCFYLALAERERLPIVSADGKLLAAARKMKTVEARKL